MFLAPTKKLPLPGQPPTQPASPQPAPGTVSPTAPRAAAAPTDFWKLATRPVMGSTSGMPVVGSGTTSNGMSPTGVGAATSGSAGGGAFAGGAGGAGAAGAAGAAGVPAVPSTGGIDLRAQASPEMAAAQEAYRKRMEALQGRAGTTDPNLQYQIEAYKTRMGVDDTQRATDRAASAVRDQMAGMQQSADQAGAVSGRGQGFGATGIAEAGQRALAGQAADIQLAQQKRLDALLLGGQATMAAPGQQQMGYEQMMNGVYGQNPYEATARLGLSQQELALKAYLGQLQAQNEAARTQAELYGSPWKMFQQLYSGF